MTDGRVPEAPTGWGHLKWLGPGFLWMVSAAGSGELLFSPRIGALYGYALVWALVGAVAFKWFINRETGRYAVCTGSPILEGFKRLPGPGNWALWVILVPQVPPDVDWAEVLPWIGFALSGAAGMMWYSYCSPPS